MTSALLHPKEEGVVLLDDKTDLPALHSLLGRLDNQRDDLRKEFADNSACREAVLDAIAVEQRRRRKLAPDACPTCGKALDAAV